MFDREAETMPRARLDALQAERLRATVARVAATVPFYHERFADAGVDAAAITAPADVARLPFTRKGDLRDNYPFGLFAVPRERIVRLHASSGTNSLSEK